MAFMAGIISLNNDLEDSEKEAFRSATRALKKEFSWPMEQVENARAIISQADFPHMWQGPKLLSGNKFDAVALGVQWRKIENVDSTLDYLGEKMTGVKDEIGNYFDYFSCSVLDKKKNRVILKTDTYGMCPLFYCLKNSCLIFSSHQTLFRSAIDDKPGINFQAALEYLIIGHNIGSKSLVNGVNALPPGNTLFWDGKNIRIEAASTLCKPKREEEMSLDRSVEELYNHLQMKCRSYFDLTDKPVAGLLSGGWDSRLLIALFEKLEKMHITYTTQQQTRFENHLISEKKIAKEVAQYLGIKNRFIKPQYRTLETQNKRARVLDYSTWFHDWAFTLCEKIPYDEYIFCDGLLGDILLRALFITPALHTTIKDGNRSKAIEILHSQFCQGFNTYTRGLEKWKSVIEPEILDEFSNRLHEDIANDIQGEPNEDFVTHFLLRNRSRRGISPLPRNVFGRKGTVLFPFADAELLRISQSVPFEYKQNQILYSALLEKARPGISQIPSTNTQNMELLGPYFLDSMADLSYFGTIRKNLSKYFSQSRMDKKVLEEYNEVLNNGRSLFGKVLTKKQRQSISNCHQENLRQSRFYLDRILILESFFSQDAI